MGILGEKIYVIAYHLEPLNPLCLLIITSLISFGCESYITGVVPAAIAQMSTHVTEVPCIMKIALVTALRSVIWPRSTALDVLGNLTNYQV